MLGRERDDELVMRLREAIRRDDEPGIGRLRERGDGGFDLADAVYGRGDRHDREGGGSGLECLFVIGPATDRRVRVGHKGEPSESGCNF